MQRAIGRKGALWPHLRWQEGLRAELQPLVDLLGAAGYLSPYQFFEHLLSGPMQGRARLLARPSFARAVEAARPLRHLLPLGAPDRD